MTDNRGPLVDHLFLVAEKNSYKISGWRDLAVLTLPSFSATGY